MGWVEKRWTAEINEVSSEFTYMNATINIIDASLITTSWDINTNTPTSTGNAVIARGILARLNWPLRAVSDPGTTTGNTSTVRAGRLAIQYSDYSGPLRDGMQVVVIKSLDNPDLERYVYRIDEAINGSNMANRVMKISVDGESGSGGTTALPSGYGISGYGDPV